MNGEILRLVDTIHRDKNIDKDVIFQGVEACIVSAVRKKIGDVPEEADVRVRIDRESGETTVYEGDEVIPISDLGRLAALQGKQVLFQKIREAERDKIFDEYETKLGKMVTGVVQRMEGPNLIVNLGSGKVEGILPRGEQAPGERFRVGERIKVLIRDVRKNHKVRITLSRTSPDFVKTLFELEVPEISEKVIEIMDVVRESGYRTKIAVATYDHNVDCVGACVGVRGARIKNIVDELFGEKIDIVRWNESIEVLIMNALKPAEITSMDLDYETKRATVYVRADQQSLAIGKRGQNVRLASKLAKWDLDIVTVSEEDIERLRKGETPGVATESETAKTAGSETTAASDDEAASAETAGDDEAVSTETAGDDEVVSVETAGDDEAVSTETAGDDDEHDTAEVTSSTTEASSEDEKADVVSVGATESQADEAQDGAEQDRAPGTEHIDPERQLDDNNAEPVAAPLNGDETGDDSDGKESADQGA